MTLLSRKADYALLILSCLHESSEPANARLIAEKFQLSRPFVANILKELCSKGFVTSTRGVKGGYVLQRPCREITLAELLEAIEDGFQLTICTDHSANHGAACDVEHICPVKGPITEIHRRMIALLRGIRLDEVFTQKQQSIEQLGFMNRPKFDSQPISSTV